MRKEYKARRDTLVEGLKKIPGVIYSGAEGRAFYVRGGQAPVDDAEKFQLFMLEEFDDNGDTLMFTPAESLQDAAHRRQRDPHGLCHQSDALKRSMELPASGTKPRQQQVSSIRTYKKAVRSRVERTAFPFSFSWLSAGA